MSRGSVMTPDGRYVAFVSAATNLVVGDTNNIADVFVRDLQAGTTTLVSVGAVPAPIYPTSPPAVRNRQKSLRTDVTWFFSAPPPIWFRGDNNRVKFMSAIWLPETPSGPAPTPAPYFNP